MHTRKVTFCPTFGLTLSMLDVQMSSHLEFWMMEPITAVSAICHAVDRRADVAEADCGMDLCFVSSD